LKKSYSKKVKLNQKMFLEFREQSSSWWEKELINKFGMKGQQNLKYLARIFVVFFYLFDIFINQKEN
jgi:hypothetical protein